VECRRLLNANGIVYIQVPDLYCPNQQRIQDFFPPEHLQTFSELAIENLCRLTGFEIVKTISGLYNLGHGFIIEKCYRSDKITHELSVKHMMDSIALRYERFDFKASPDNTDFLNMQVDLSLNMSPSQIYSLIVQNFGALHADKLIDIYARIGGMIQ
jgi:hypothetical protein